MSESKNIKIHLAGGAIRDCSIEISQPFPWKLTLLGLDLPICEFSGNDLFDALIALRLELEKIGAQPLCAGARFDVFPSGMSREIGGRSKADVNPLGLPALRTQLVDIFDFAETASVGTVEKQRVFHEKWIESLRSQRK